MECTRRADCQVVLCGLVHSTRDVGVWAHGLPFPHRPFPSYALWFKGDQPRPKRDRRNFHNVIAQQRSALQK